jgi:sugar phosphate isomerase/epimerase
MNAKSRMNRRRFLGVASATTLIAATGPWDARGADKGVKWPIGCFNRPWTKWSYDETLDGIKAAGYKLTGLLTRTKTDALVGADATPEYLDSLKKRIAARGLKANMAALRSRHNIPVEDSIKEVRQQVDNAARIGLEYLLTFGVNSAEQYDHYYRVMADTAAHAQKAGIKLVVKPHGGGSGSSSEMLVCLQKVNHPNFKIWYDAGNIIHYTGKDPVADLEPIAQHVTGFCAKDCATQKGEVMIQFGEGRVDFVGVFRVLKKAGFNGPLMVECCKIGATAEETTANARANREFLERAMSAV